MRRLNRGLENYQQKVKAGQIKPKKPSRMTPIERAKANPNSLKYAILAKCYDCMGGYADGRRNCGVNSCPLYKWMPYKRS